VLTAVEGPERLSPLRETQETTDNRFAMREDESGFLRPRLRKQFRKRSSSELEALS
jgi:hypothetical protein